MLNFKLHKKENTNNSKVIKLLGIKLYEELVEPNYTKRKFLYGLVCVSRPTDSKKYSLEQKDFLTYLVDTRLKYIHYDITVKFFAQSIHPNTFGKYKCCNTGKDVYLIACGPTLKFFSGDKRNGVFVGVNRSFLYSDIKLDCLFVQDDLGKEMQAAIKYNPKKCKKFFGIIPHNRMKECQAIPALQHINRISIADAMKAGADRYILNDYPVDYWPYDISNEPLRDFGGTAISAMQFILYTNPKRIFLVGCDCSDDGHFYGGPTEKFSENIIIWKKMKEYLLQYFSGIEIISVNPIGLRGLFNDVYTQEFLEKHPEITEVKVLK